MPDDEFSVAGRCGMFVLRRRCATAPGCVITHAPVFGVPGPGSRLDQRHGRVRSSASRPALLQAIPTPGQHTNLTGTDV
ncbi:hypothetical protein C9J60_19895 [Streptomyces sp. A244]|nr:hypothetical protein C9J60_19895 [Streptomyces sp. A244]